MAGPFSTAITTLLASARDCRRAASFGVPSTTPRSCPSPEMSRSPTTISGCLCRHEPATARRSDHHAGGEHLRGREEPTGAASQQHVNAKLKKDFTIAGCRPADAPSGQLVSSCGGRTLRLPGARVRMLVPARVQPGWPPGPNRLTPPCHALWEASAATCAFWPTGVPVSEGLAR